MRITIDLEDDNILTPEILNAIGSAITTCSPFSSIGLVCNNTTDPVFDYNNFKKLTPNGVNTLRDIEKGIGVRKNNTFNVINGGKTTKGKEQS